jgi:hypothetical protein
LKHDRSRAIAWVVEEIGGFDDDDDATYALGLFSAHIEAEGLPEGFLSGPDRVPEVEAVAWAREHAAKVVVRTCESWENVFYSAGEIPRKGVAPWPEGGLGLERRRLPGWTFLDRTDADDVIAWEVIVGGRPADPRTAPGFEERFRRALASDASVEVVAVRFRPPPTEGAFFLGFGDILATHVRAEGRTVREVGDAAIRACAEAAGPGWEWSADAYPVGSRAAKANAGLG